MARPPQRLTTEWAGLRTEKTVNNIDTEQTRMNTGQDARAAPRPCVLCHESYRPVKAEALGRDGPLLCAACSTIARQLLDEQQDREETAYDSRYQPQTNNGRTIPSLTSTRRGLELRELRTHIDASEAARFGVRKSRRPTRRIQGPLWMNNRGLLKQIFLHLKSDRRGSSSGFSAARSLAAAYLYWRVGWTLPEAAAELGITRRALEGVLVKFRRRGDRFLKAKLLRRLPVEVMPALQRSDSVDEPVKKAA